MPRKPGKTIDQIEQDQTELEVVTKTESSYEERPQAKPQSEKTREEVVQAEVAPAPNEEIVRETGHKELEIVMTPMNHWKVRWTGAQGGAPIPAVLKGTWTRRDLLQEKINRYYQERDAA